MNTVGFRLKKIRKNKRLTLEALANGASSHSGRRMTKSAISEIEREANKNFRPENLYAVAEFLEVDPKWLATGNGAVSAYHETVGKRIAEARQKNGWSQGDLVRHINAAQGGEFLSLASLHRIEHGVRIEIVPSLSAYAKVLGISEQWLSGETDESQVELTNWALNRHHDDIVIPQFSPTGGIPTDLEHDTVVSQVLVNKLWIRENLSLLSSPSNLAMITGCGDSMEGTFNHGDVLFIDTGVDAITMDAVYVLNLNNELYIKRLQRKPDGSILMISDNAKYHPYVIQSGEKFQVLGRIVGIWNFKKM